jgi:hypothetical protein
MRQKIRSLVKVLDISTFVVLFFVIFVIYKISQSENIQKISQLQDISSTAIQNSIEIIENLSTSKLKSQKNQIHIMAF